MSLFRNVAGLERERDREMHAFLLRNSLPHSDFGFQGVLFRRRVLEPVSGFDFEKVYIFLDISFFLIARAFFSFFFFAKGFEKSENNGKFFFF